MNQIRRALISVSDKTGLVPFANALAARGVELVSTVRHRGGAAGGGPRRHARRGPHGRRGDARRPREDAAPGDARRHPRAPRRATETWPRCARAASSRSTSSSSTSTRSSGSPRRRDVDEAELRRAHRHRRAGDAARRGQELPRRRRRLRARALRLRAVRARRQRRRAVAAAPAASSRPRRSRTRRATTPTIANWFTEAVDFPERLFVEMVKHTELPYGENPHQRAAYYAERGARRHVLSMVHQHGGRGVTFNNIADISAGARHRARVHAAGAA